jgi:nitrite reductase (NADH) small subunit
MHMRTALNEAAAAGELGPSTLIPPGEGRVFEVGARRVSVFRARDGELFATQADCPHRGGPLADGLLGDGRVVCPLHGLQFDLRTGEAVRHDCLPLLTYSITETPDGRILLGPARPGRARG